MKLDSSDTRIQAIIVFVLLKSPREGGFCTPGVYTPCTTMCTPFGVFPEGRKVVDWKRLAARIEAPLEARVRTRQLIDQVADIVGAAHDPKRLAELAVEIVMSLSHAQRGAVFAVEAENLVLC